MKQETIYDEQGRESEVIWYDDSGSIAENELGVARMKSTYLNEDSVSRAEHNYDVHDEPIEDKLGAAFLRKNWNPETRIMKETYHNLEGDLVEVLYGFCEVHYHMDADMDMHSAYCYDRLGKLVEEPGVDNVLVAGL